MKDHSFSYQIRQRWHKKIEDLKQDKYSRESDILYKRHGGEKALFIVMFTIFAITSTQGSPLSVPSFAKQSDNRSSFSSSFQLVPL